MPRPRKYLQQEFVDAVEQSTNWREVCRKLSVASSGERYSSFRAYAAQMNLDVSHLESGRREPLKYERIEELLVEDSPWRSNPGKMKQKLVREGIMEDLCSRCGTPPEWNGEPLTLQLDHINGISADYRLENLRVLCPNCHTQTSTWGNKCREPKRKEEPEISVSTIRLLLCSGCGGQVSKGPRCKSCAGKMQPNKILWPRTLELETMVEQSSYEEVGRILGVSGKSVANRIKRH